MVDEVTLDPVEEIAERFLRETDGKPSLQDVKRLLAGQRLKAATVLHEVASAHQQHFVDKWECRNAVDDLLPACVLRERTQP